MEVVAIAVSEKSKERCEKAYITFEHWRNKKNIKVINASVFLAFFAKRGSNYLLFNLWNIFNAKIELSLNKNIKINKLYKLNTM